MHRVASLPLVLPLRIIQEVSGHRSLEVLEEYLAVRDDQLSASSGNLFCNGG